MLFLYRDGHGYLNIWISEWTFVFDYLGEYYILRIKKYRPISNEKASNDLCGIAK